MAEEIKEIDNGTSHHPKVLAAGRKWERKKMGGSARYM